MNEIFFILIYKTPLHMAVEIGNPDIVGILLSHPKIDINMILIYFLNSLMPFQINIVNIILIQTSIKFQIKKIFITFLTKYFFM